MPHSESGGKDAEQHKVKECLVVWGTRGSGGVCHIQSVQMRVKTGVADPQLGDDSLHGHAF